MQNSSAPPQSSACRRRPGFSIFLHLACNPCHQKVYDFFLLAGAQLHPFRHAVPFIETSPAAAGARVLRQKNRVAVHGRLPAVVRYDSRCQPLPDKILRVAADRIHAFFPDIGFVFFFKSETGPKLGSLQFCQRFLNCLHVFCLLPCLPLKYPGRFSVLSIILPNRPFLNRCAASGMLSPDCQFQECS